ncbi:MAG: queuosine precursor transporter [Candidatus Diapherotrites archaeon]|uniref:Probable queuosine precursor transporter n=1 Tax=Candidatus Iainarchaeum sp. TaxID=3101447 RepID=A0A938YX75_9ARCH|nr:queuosine precursor transporter [Candidatus Diapherotrites archaeon]
MQLEKKTNFLLALFVGCLVTANLIGLKVAYFGLFEASVGILVFPILFLITDIVEEVHGKERAKEFVYAGLGVLVIVLAATGLAVLLPAAERSFVSDEEYAKIFGTTLRIFAASIVGFFISQMHDVWAFNFWKGKTHGKYLWLRNNASTIVSQFIDTTIFMFIAFYAISPKFTVEYVFALIIPYWLVKVLFAVFDTPFCYLGVKWLRGNEKAVS